MSSQAETVTASYHLQEMTKLEAERNAAALAWTKLTDSQEQEIDVLKAKIERLQAALREIADTHSTLGLKMHSIARAALEEK